MPAKSAKKKPAARGATAKVSSKEKAARAAGRSAPAKGRAPAATRQPARARRAGEPVDRTAVSGLRTLGREVNAERSDAVARADEKLAEKAREVLQAEFDRVLAIKDKLEAETKIGATEKGREATRHDEKLRSLILSLEGMNRFALQLGLLTPAESRELYAQAMKRGLYGGWRT